MKKLICSSAVACMILAASVSFAQVTTDNSFISIGSGVTSTFSQGSNGIEDAASASAFTTGTANSDATGTLHANTFVAGTVDAGPSFSGAAQIDLSGAREWSLAGSAVTGEASLEGTAHGHDNFWFGPDQADVQLQIGGEVNQGSQAFSDSRDSWSAASQGQTIDLDVSKTGSDSAPWFDTTANVNIAVEAEFLAAGGSVAYANDNAAGTRAYVASATGSVFGLQENGVNNTTIAGGGMVQGQALIANRGVATYDNSYTFDGSSTNVAAGFTAGSALVETNGNATTATSSSTSQIIQF